MTTSANSWINVPKPISQAQLRLFCFPYGGGGASVFRAWPQGLPGNVEVCAVQLPGRENRLLETPFTDLFDLVMELVNVLCPFFNIPFAFFGHSLGAFIGFELAREIRRRGLNGLTHLFVSGQRAPQIPDVSPPLYQLPDDEFIEQVQQQYEGIPLVVLQNEEMMKIFLPLLRADFTMNDTYLYTDGPPLDCPIVCLGGRQDPETTHETLEAWQEQTSKDFRIRMFHGDHFFIQSEQAGVLQALSEELEQWELR